MSEGAIMDWETRDFGQIRLKSNEDADIQTGPPTMASLTRK